MRNFVRNTLDFEISRDKRAALDKLKEQRPGVADVEGKPDDSYRPWNQKFENPDSSLDLPQTASNRADDSYRPWNQHFEDPNNPPQLPAD